MSQQKERTKFRVCRREHDELGRVSQILDEPMKGHVVSIMRKTSRRRGVGVLKNTHDAIAHFRIPSEMNARLDIAARKLGVSKSKIVRDIIEEFLDKICPDPIQRL